jgi:hypothetical protein
LIELGEQIGHAQTAGGHEVAMGARDADDQASATEAPQVIGHLVLSVGASEERLDEASQIPVAEAMHLQAVVSQGGQQGHGTGITEAQSRDAMALDEQGALELRELFAIPTATVGETFGLEQAPVGALADRLELPKIGQALANPEVGRVVDGGFGAQGAPLFEVLFDLAVLVLDVEAGIDAVGDDPGPVTVRRRRGVKWTPNFPPCATLKFPPRSR